MLKSLTASLLICFNVLDTFFTLKYIKYGPLEEGNPILQSLVYNYPCLFAFLKVFGVTAFTLFLWMNNHKITKKCLTILSIFYICLMFLWGYVIFNI